MLKATNFVLRAKGNVKFNVCIDNEWFDGLDAREAVSVIVDYEIKQSEDVEIDWSADVMDWFISEIEDNTIVMWVI